MMAVILAFQPELRGQTGEPSSPMGTEEPPLSEGGSHAGILERGSTAMCCYTADLPQAVKAIWRTFGQADVNLFVTKENFH